MKPKEDKVLYLAIEAGINLGFNRAYKHSTADRPSDEEFQTELFESIILQLYEWFEIGDSLED